MTLTKCQLKDREMSMKRIDAEEAIRKTAAKEGLAVEEIRKEIEKAILVGLRSQDPAIRERWKKIPCKSDVPTPEELIQYMAENMKENLY